MSCTDNVLSCCAKSKRVNKSPPLCETMYSTVLLMSCDKKL